MKILAIETSCDETAVSVLECLGGVKKPGFNILSNIVFSQVELHMPFGGVVPNLARREHQKNLVPILTRAIEEADLLAKFKLQITNYKKNSKSKIQKILEREPELFEQIIKFLNEHEVPKIDLIAVTNGPGLEPALWVGVNFVRALSRAWQIPVLGVNHLEGHIFSVFLKENRKENYKFTPTPKFGVVARIQNPKSKIQNEIPKIKFPAVALIVSGGHTEIVIIYDWLKYKIIGSTLDDAAGEAFDKAARILGLGYPGGPAISREAEKWKPQILNSKSKIISHPTGDREKGEKIPVEEQVYREGKMQNLNNQNSKQEIVLPRPMINSKDFNFSFSGLKTAILYLVNGLKKNAKWSEELIPQIAREFQDAVVDVLVSKSLKAAEKYNIKSFILCGGVSANKELRERMQKEINEKFARKIKFLMPDLEFSGDNAAMIAAAAYPNYLNLKSVGKLSKIAVSLKANGNLNF